MPSRLSFIGAVSRLVGFVAVSAVIGMLASVLVLPIAGGLGVTSQKIASVTKQLPTSLDVNALPQTTKVLARDGSVLALWYDQNRVDVTLDQVAPIMREALLATEDYRFFQHGALDLKGTLRAFITNQISGGVVQGGSSITQQLVKMTLFNQATTEAERQAVTADTYQRKIEELRYAMALEQNYSKDWILQRYLNLVYFGDGAYGVEAAARHYFGVDASKLTIKQAALLAGLVQNPTAYNPVVNPQNAITRRNEVLTRMADLSVITPAEEAQAKAAPLGLHVKSAGNDCISSIAPFFCDYVKRYLLADTDLGSTLEERQNLLYSGGLTIQTTLDPRFQKASDKAVRKHVYPKDNAIGGLAMVVPGNGQVRALSQSRPMGPKKKKGQTFLNYVVPPEYGDANGFQAGSTFKVFVLASAINQGFPANAYIPAPPRMSIPISSYSYCDGPLQSTQNWNVANSTGFGIPAFNLYTGTQESVNTFFAQLEQRTGLCEPIKLARSMGVTVLDKQIAPTFTLGTPDTNPLTMAAVYATFAARGLYCAPMPVTKITDQQGNVVKNYQPTCNQVMPDTTADEVNDILRGVQEPGGFGYYAHLNLRQPSAGKTGTTDYNKAVWFIGYTPNLAAASMIAGANKDGHWVTLNGQKIGGRYVSQAFGSTYAGPIWGDAMHKIQKYLKNLDFVPPTAKTLAGQPIAVPDVTGLTQKAAFRRIKKANLTPVLGKALDSEVGAGLVVSTNPSGGSEVAMGTAIIVHLSTGNAPPPPPPPPTTPPPTSPPPTTSTPGP
jgi:membrane peptidoglycan carboxypeptidase